MELMCIKRRVNDMHHPESVPKIKPKESGVWDQFFICDSAAKILWDSFSGHFIRMHHIFFKKAAAEFSNMAFEKAVLGLFLLAPSFIGQYYLSLKSVEIDTLHFEWPIQQAILAMLSFESTNRDRIHSHYSHQNAATWSKLG